MKFLQIRKGVYINIERIDGIAVNDKSMAIFIGGSDEAWMVDEPYTDDILEFVQSKFWILSKEKE